jgi:hypothetical protein
MLLNEYCQELNQVLGNAAETSFVLSSTINVDYRSETIGLIKGNVYFSDNSVLYFTEYVDVETEIEKFSYSYHYQNKNNDLIFRYDNAAHKPALNFDSHKHIGENIVFAAPPSLDSILKEILINFGKF